MSSVRFEPVRPTIEQLKLRAASGSSGVSKRAQQELRQRMHEALRKAVG